MPLESLSNEQINIHDLTLEQEKKPNDIFLKKYADLKNLPFYISGKNIWLDEIDADQTLNRFYQKRLSTQPQLIAVAVESFLNIDDARNHYNELKNDIYYDNAAGEWNEQFEETIRGMETAQICRNVTEQFWGIWMECSYGNKEDAKKTFERLEEMYKDDEVGLWNGGMLPKSSYGEINNIFSSADQLLAIIVENNFNHESASKNYQFLKNSLFAGTSDGLWRCHIRHITEENQLVADDDFVRAESALLQAIAQSIFEPAEGLRTMKTLKNSKFYDDKLHQWNSGESSMGFSEKRTSTDQLLGILAEFFNQKKANIQHEIPPLPETRSY